MSAPASQKLSLKAMVFTAILFPAYVVAAALTNSAAIMTDLIATSFDLMALTTCWVVLRIAHSAHAGRFAYGLGKLENLAELIIAILQTILVVIAGTNVVLRIMHPEPIEGAEVGLVITAVAAIGNFAFNRQADRLARQTRSPLLDAQARVHFVSAISSGSVFAATAILTILDDVPVLYYLDPICAAAVIGVMIYNIYAMLTNSMGSLLDQALDEAGQFRILKVLASHFENFSELGDIRTRHFGSKLFVELHLGFDDSWTVGKTRGVVATLSEEIKREFREVGDEIDVAIVLMPAHVEADELARAQKTAMCE